MKENSSQALQVLQQNAATIDPSLWHYNVALTQARLKNFPLARYHLIRAQSLGVSGKEVEQSRILVEQHLDVQRLEKSINFTDRVIKTGLEFSEGPFTSLSLIFLFIGLWCLKSSPSLKRALSFRVLISFPLVLDLWIGTWPRKISLREIPVLDGPSGVFPSRGVLPAGILIVTTKNGEWEKIRFPSRFEGWIKSETLISLENE